MSKDKKEQVNKPNFKSNLTFFEKLAVKIRKKKKDNRQKDFDAAFGGDVPAEIYAGAQAIKGNTNNDLVDKVERGFLGVVVADRLHKRAHGGFYKIGLLSLLVGGVIGGIAGAVGNGPGSVAIGLAMLAIVVLNILTLTGLKQSKLARRFLPKGIFNVEDAAAANELINRTMIRDFDEETTPEDLQDNFRNLTIDVEGNPVDGQIMITDIEVPTFRNTLNFFKAEYNIMFFTGFLFSSGLAYSIIEGTSGGYSGMASAAVYGSISAFFGFLFFLSFLFGMTKNSPLAVRMAAATKMQRSTAAQALVDKVGPDYYKSIEKARQSQIENASRDKTNFIKLGETTGVLSERRDPFAPSEEGMPFGMTMEDLSTHLAVIGQTGSGKTSGVLRPIFAQVMTNPDFNSGLFVLDGKGALPLELTDLSEDYKLINPEHSDFNPIENLTADEVSDSLYEMFGSASDDDFWNLAAAKLIRASANLLEMTNEPWTLTNVYRAVIDDDYVQDVVCPQLPALSAMKAFQRSAAEYRLKTHIGTPEKTRGSIDNTAGLWLSTLTDNQKLSHWADAEHGVLVESVCEGAKVGLALPEAIYGLAGAVISNLAKKRIYNAIKKRGDTWKQTPGQTQVILLIDEFQNIFGRGNQDAAMLSIARSLGLVFIGGTQNIDGVQMTLGSEDATNQFFGNILSMIALRSDTDLTRKFISRRMGSEWKAVVDKVSTIPDTKFEFNAIQTSGVDSLIRSTTLGDDIKGSTGFGRTASAAIYNFAENAIDPIRSLITGNDASYVDSNIKNVNIVGEDEISTMLAVPNTALAQIYRGRVQRRDVITLTPIYRD